MSFFRQYIIPLIILAIFIVALVAVSSRAFLPSDMAQPAPVGTDVSYRDSLFSQYFGA